MKPVATPGRPLLRLDGIAKTFSNGVTAITDVGLTIRPGEFVSLLGPSGCGKSTLLKLIAGLAAPSAGSIDWPQSAYDAAGTPEPSLGFVFQEPTLLPWRTVADNVHLPLMLAGVGKSDAKQRVAEVLELVADVQWVTSEPEGAGYRVPANVKLELQSEDVEALLLSGDLDAVILPNIAQSFRSGDSRIHRVFADCRDAVQNYFQDTGIFPITHALVTHERLVSEHPWLCQELITAFNEADHHCRLEYEYPKRFSFPTAALFLEEEEQRFGKNPWSHGLAP